MVKATHKQTFIGIWFHDNTLSSDQQDKMKIYLDRMFYYYRIFIDMRNFYKYIGEGRLVTKIFLIISISDLSLFSLVDLALKKTESFEKVYIFWPTKIITSACFHTTNIDDLFTEISNDINVKMKSSNCIEDELYAKPITICDMDKALPPLTVFNPELTQASLIRHLTKESVKFISFLILRDILIQKSYGKNELEEMCVSCRVLHGNDSVELKHIDKFQKKYKEKKAIKYYTKPWFLFRTINQVCGTEDMEEIYKFRTYIRDLHKNLNELNNDQEKSDLQSCIRKVYRGKPIAGSVLQKLMDNEGGLISINGFLSTTVDRKVALRFAGHNENKAPGIQSTLFLLRIGKEKMSQPYAYISIDGTNQNEYEVLFSLGTVWRIKSIKANKDLYTIELTSCEELDSELTQLLEKYTDKKATLISLGDILLEFGHEAEAEWCYRKMLDQQCNDDDETNGILYYKIGMIQFEKKLYDAALINLKRAKRLLQRSKNKLNELTSSRSIYIYCTQPPLLRIYNNIGVILEKKGRFEEAATNYEQALNEESSSSELATVYNNLGLLHFRRGNYVKAYGHQEEACQRVSDKHPHSVEFNKNLKRTATYLNYITRNEESKQKKQKTT